MERLDPRLHPHDGTVAAIYLKGRVEADQFLEPVPMQVAVSVAHMTRTADAASLSNQLLLGETVDCYNQRDGKAWVQARADGYTGFVDVAALVPACSEQRQRVTARQSHLYPEPDFKSIPVAALPFLAEISQDGQDGDFARTALGYVPLQHLKPLDAEPVAIAETFLGCPYLWGGRSALGLDCSALVQLAHLGAGYDCPRDSDQQQAGFGDALAPDAPLQRGDLVFWKGHVGIMTSPTMLLHANIHHMATAIEPLAEAEARINATASNPISGRRRLAGKP